MVVAMIAVRVVLVSVGMIVMGVRGVAVPMIGMIHFVAAGVARVGAHDRDRARKQRADERQKNDGLDHDNIPA
jgi:hypothetical protein